MARKDPIFSLLFVAAPELLLEEVTIRWLRANGHIDDETVRRLRQWRKNAARVRTITEATKGRSVFSRILAVAPEIALSPMTVDFLRAIKAISPAQGHALRLASRAVGAVTSGGMVKDRQDVMRRARLLFGVGASEEAISLLRSIGSISAEEANAMRAALLVSSVSVETLKKAVGVKKLTDALALAGSGLVDARTIRALKLSGAINGKTANALLNAVGYGSALWRVWEGRRRAEGLAARMAYVVSGSFSWEAVDFLKSLGFLSKDQERYLKYAVAVSQAFNRTMMQEMTDRRYRVRSGEAPIATYARAARETDADLLRLLAEASRESQQEAERLSRKMQAARAGQYIINARALHQAMRSMWEGQGYLTIFGESRVAAAAVEASEFMQNKIYKNLHPMNREMLKYQGRVGIDSYISRKENTLQLSRRVYKNFDLSLGRVDKQIKLGLLTGQSSVEIANRVKQYIDPKVPGGASYAAMRLGRTELANAFHNTTIRHSREMPWVKGYRWQRSGSHSHSDICDEYATDDHANLGPGVFKKTDVPQKPHPHCMCWLEIVEVDESQFIKSMKKGYYDRYLSTVFRSEGVDSHVRSWVQSQFAQRVGSIAGQVALTKGVSVLARMMEANKDRPHGVNPVKASMEYNSAVARGLHNPFVQGSVLHEMVSDMEGHFARSASISEPPSREDIEKAIARAAKTGNNDEMVRLLGKRQFDFLTLRAAADIYNKDHPNLALPAGHRRGDPRIDPFDRTSYEDILSIASDAQSAPTLASTMYGTSAYRLINRNLRLSRGDLKRYDREFGNGDQLFKELRHASRDGSLATQDGTLDIMNALGDTAEEWGLDPNDKYTDEAYYLDRLMQSMFFNMDEYSNHSDIVRKLDSRMGVTNGDRFVYRAAGEEWYGLDHDITKSDVGHIFKDDGFVSTEGVKRYFTNTDNENLGIDTSRRPVRAQIMVPDGSRAMRLNDFEYEILLSRGSYFQVLDVVEEDFRKTGFSKTVHLSLVEQDALKSLKDPDDIDEDVNFWDDIVMDF